MALKELTKSTFILALPKVISFFIKLARAKLNAVFLGTEGVGIVNQLITVSTKIGAFSTLSLNVGAKKIIVEYNKDGEKRKEIKSINGIFTIATTGLVLIFFITGLFYIDELSNYFLGNQPTSLFLAAFLIFPLIALRAVPTTTLIALMQFKTISRIEIIITIISFLLYIPLIIMFAVEGAVANIVIANILFFAAYTYITFNKVAKKQNLQLISLKNLKINKSTIKELATISTASSLLGLYAMFCELTIRGILATNLGMDKIGIYAPIIVWSGFFSSFFLPALFQYIFPKYGSCKTNKELTNVANDAFRMLSFIIVPFVLIIIAYNDILIPIFYSKEFLGASLYLPVHFIGIFFWTWMRVLKQMLIPTGRIKHMIPFVIIENSLFLAVVFIFVNKIGLWAWTLRFSIIPLILFIAYIIYLAKQIDFKIYKINIILMIYGIISSGFLYYFILKYESLFFIRGIITLTFIALLLLFIRNKEKKILIKTIKKYTSFFNK